MAARYQGARNARVGAYRSGLEDKNAEFLEKLGVPYEYEKYHLVYEVPARAAKYHPDFVLSNGIIVETKGLFDVEDRRKHMLIKEQHPELDIRFVFSSSRAKIYKGSPTSYAEWAEKNGFKFADKLIPKEWLKEARKEVPPGILISKGGQ